MAATRTRWLLTALAVVMMMLLAACAESEPVGDTGTDTAAPVPDGAGGEETEATDSGEVSGPVRTVLIYPETGPLAAVAGETIGNGTQVAVDMWNEQHAERQVEYQTCNDEGDPERGISCVERHVEEVDIILGPHFGAVYKAAEPLMGDSQLTVVSTPHAFPDGSNAIFQAIPTADMAMQSAVQYMKDQGWDKFAMLTSSDTTGTTARDSGIEVAEEAGIEISNHEFDPESEDLTGQVNAIANEDVDTLFIWSSGAQVVTALRAVQSVGLDMPIFLNYSSMSRPLMELAGGAIPEELLFTGSEAFAPDLIDDEERRQRVETFVENYREVSGGSDPDWNAFTVADSALVAFTAALNADTPEGMQEFLESGEEIAGNHAEFSYSPDNHLGLEEADNPVTILRWTGDGWEPAS